MDQSSENNEFKTLSRVNRINQLVLPNKEQYQVGSFEKGTLEDKGQLAFNLHGKELVVKVFEALPKKRSFFSKMSREVAQLEKLHRNMGNILARMEQKCPELVGALFTYEAVVVLKRDAKINHLLGTSTAEIHPYSTEDVIVLNPEKTLDENSLSHELTHHLMEANFGHTRDFTMAELPAMALSGEYLSGSAKSDHATNPESLIDLLSTQEPVMEMKKTILSLVGQERLPLTWAEMSSLLRKNGKDIPLGSLNYFKYMLASSLALEIRSVFPENWQMRVTQVYREAVILEHQTRASNDHGDFEFNREQLAQILSHGLGVSKTEADRILDSSTRKVWNH